MSAFEELRAEMVLDADGVSRGVSNAERSLGGLKTAIGATGAAAAGLAAGGLAASVSKAAEFEQQMVELEKVTNPETAREMGDAIQDMAGKMPLAQGELAGIAEQAGRLGIEGTDNIRNFTQVTGEMATATDLTAEDAADSLARMTTLMNEPVENVRTLGDSINALSNSMATSSSEITDAATRSSGALTNMGMASEDVLALNAAMNEVSPSARVAGTQLRRMSQELMNPKKVSDIASALGMTADEFKSMRSNDPTGVIQLMAQRMDEGGESAEALRGTLSTTSRQALAGLSNNLDGMNQALETSSEQFKEGGSLASEFETAMGTFKNQVQLAKNSLNNIAITVGNVLLPHLTTLMKYVTGVLQRFQSFNQATNGVAATLGLIGTAIGGTLVALQTLLPLVANGTTLFGILGTAVGALSLPLVAATAAVVGLAAVFSGRLPEILATVDRVFGQLPGKIQRGVNTALEWLRSTGVPMARQAFETMVRRGVEAVALLREWLPPRIRGAVEAGLAWLRSTGVPLAVQGFQQFATQAVAGLEILAARLPPLISRAVTAGTEWLLTTGVPLAMTAFGRFVDVATAALGRLVEILPPVVNRAVSALVAWLRSSGIPLFRSALTTYLNTASEVFGLLREHLPPLVRQAVTAMVGWLRENGPPLIRTAFGLLTDAARTAFGLIKEYLPPLVREGVTAVATWVRENGPGLLKSAFKLIGTGIRTVVLGIFGEDGSLRSLVSDGIGYLATYLKEDAKEDLKTAIGIAFDALVAAGKTALEALTPPDGIIVQIIGDIATYIQEEGPGLLKAAAELAFDAIMAAAEGLYEGLIGGSLFPELFQDISSYIETTAKTLITDAITAVKDDAMAIFDTLHEDITSWGGDVADTIEQAFLDAKSYAETVVENMKDSVVDLIGGIGDAGAEALKSAFNSAMPSSVGIDPVSVAGKQVFGGASIPLPSLDTGGVIEDDGIYVGHAGERVLNPAETRQYNNGGGGDGGGDNVEIHFDFGDLDDDALISIGALKQIVKEDVREDNERKLKRGST